MTIKNTIIDFVAAAPRTLEEIVTHASDYRPRVVLRLKELVRDGWIEQSWVAGRASQYTTSPGRQATWAQRAQQI